MAATRWWGSLLAALPTMLGCGRGGDASPGVDGSVEDDSGGGDASGASPEDGATPDAVGVPDATSPDAGPPSCGEGFDAGAGPTFYVSPSGSDSNTGTQASPFATIQHAADLTTPGTTVHVAPGSYAQCVSTHVSGTAAAPILFVSDSPWGAKLDVSQVTACGGAAWEIQGDYVEVRGFDVTAAPAVFLGIRTNGSNAKVVGNRVHDFGTSGCNGTSGGAGIDNTNYSASDNDIIGNVVFGIGPTSTCIGVHGIYTSQRGGHIVNNISSNNSGYGVHCWHGCTAVVIANNLTFNNRTGGIVLGDGDSGATVFDKSTISNNIAVHNAGYGISEYEYSGQHTVGPSNKFLNNLVYGNATGGIALIEGNTDSGTIARDPLFVKYLADGSGDYHLAATSPAVDTGAATGAPGSDFDGVCRPHGKGFDVGPYER
jgi:hypothetical protein